MYAFEVFSYLICDHRPRILMPLHNSNQHVDQNFLHLAGEHLSTCILDAHLFEQVFIFEEESQILERNVDFQIRAVRFLLFDRCPTWTDFFGKKRKSNPIPSPCSLVSTSDWLLLTSGKRILVYLLFDFLGWICDVNGRIRIIRAHLTTLALEGGEEARLNQCRLVEADTGGNITSHTEIRVLRQKHTAIIVTIGIQVQSTSTNLQHIRAHLVNCTWNQAAHVLIGSEQMWKRRRKRGRGLDGREADLANVVFPLKSE